MIHAAEENDLVIVKFMFERFEVFGFLVDDAADKKVIVGGFDGVDRFAQAFVGNDASKPGVVFAGFGVEIELAGIYAVVCDSSRAHLPSEGLLLHGFADAGEANILGIVFEVIVVHVEFGGGFVDI